MPLQQRRSVNTFYLLKKKIYVAVHYGKIVFNKTTLYHFSSRGRGMFSAFDFTSAYENTLKKKPKAHKATADPPVGKC